MTKGTDRSTGNSLIRMKLLGNAYFKVPPQLKVVQEITTMIIFAGFCVFYMRERLTLDYLWASLCLVGSAFFIFRHLLSTV